MGKALLACVLLGAALYLFLYSCMATASDAQGGVIFLFTLAPMLGFLLAAAWLTRAQSRRLYRVTQGGLLFLLGFLGCLFVPGLNLLPAAMVGGVAAGYKAIYGVTPYQAHHKAGLVELLRKGFEAQDRQSLDLRHLTLGQEWNMICVIRTGVPAKAGLTPAAAQALESAGPIPGYTLVALLNEVDVVQSGLVSTDVPFAKEAVDQCLPRKQAVYRTNAQKELVPESL